MVSRFLKFVRFRLYPAAGARAQLDCVSGGRLSMRLLHITLST
jgi:hypothetical protein